MYSLGTDQIINDSMKEVKWWHEVVMCQVCPARVSTRQVTDITTGYIIIVVLAAHR